MAGGHPRMPDLSRESPFDVLQDRPDSGASPWVLDGVRACQYRMTSYDEDQGGLHFTPAYGIQFHDPWLLEYVGAPESARLLSRSPEYWLHHEKTLLAAFQLQHDAGLFLSNVQVLQQFVTAINRTSSEVMRIAFGRRPFPSDVMQQVVPSYQVRRAAHYMAAMGLWRPPITPGNPETPAVSDMQCLHVMQRLLPGSATVILGGDVGLYSDTLNCFIGVLCCMFTFLAVFICVLGQFLAFLTVLVGR